MYGESGLVSKLCPTLCVPTVSPPDSSVHGLLQARVLERAAVSFSRGSSQPRDRTCASCVADGLFTVEPPGKPHAYFTTIQTNDVPFGQCLFIYF